jgi:hypothetical protein
MTDDSTHNPETDTFQYIRLVIEALNKMSRLDMAVDTIEQRLPVELFKVVDKSNNEVAQRHPSILRAYSAKKKGKAKTEVENEDVRTTLLNDLMWTLYARFEAIAESHRVVHDVVAGIVRRENRAASSATLTRGFKELWKLYQSEVGDLQCFARCFTYRLPDAVTSSRLSSYRRRSLLQKWSRSVIYRQCILACSSGSKQAHVQAHRRGYESF